MALWVFSLFAILLASGSALAQQEITVNTDPIAVSLQSGAVDQIEVTITNDGDAPLTWSASLEDVYGRGRGVSFSKANFANWIFPENQDRISDNLWIARNNNQSIFNAKSETSSDNASPEGTEWAFGVYNDATTFDTFRNMHGNDPQSLIGNTTTLHDIAEGVYYELDFTSWSGSNTGGGFAYTRYEMFDYVSFEELVEGPLATGGSVIITIVLDTDGLDSDTFVSNLVITSDDTDESEITIPINLEVLEPATFELSATSFTQTVTTGDEPVTQTLTISNNGSSALSWNANGTEERPSEMSGVTLSSFGDEVAASGTQDVTITFADNGNNEGTYEWPITFFSNDLLNPVETVTVSLEIIGKPFIDFDAPGNFGNTFVGGTSDGTLTIYNEGTGELSITGITSSASQFVPTATALTVAPGEFEEVTVLFTPDAAGVVTGDLTIASNDAENPSVTVPVEGTGVDAPAIDVSPVTITESLSGSEIASNTITVANSGDGELQWSINVNGNALQPIGTFFMKESGADESLEANQDRISGEVWLTRANSNGVFNAFEESSYSGSTSTVEWARGTTAEASPGDYTSFKNALDNVGGEILTTTLSLHLIAEDRYFDIVFETWDTNQSGGGFSYTRREVFTWLSTDETIVDGETNITAADASTMFDLDIDGSQLFEGDFVGTATITSNDPLEPALVITVNASATGTPDISATETTAATSSESGSSATLEIPIVNSGKGALEVTNVASDNGVLVPSETSFTVPPLSTYFIEATFTPAAVQVYDIDLTVSSDDPVVSSLVIDVTAEGLPVPAFNISETTFEATLEAGNFTTATFTISNTGAGTLNWGVEEVSFTKVNYADISLEENQDRIKEDVWITRAERQPIFNYFENQSYNSNTETIMYGDGQTSSLSFSDYDSDFRNATDFCGSCLVGNTLSLYLVDYDEYYDLDVSFWQNSDGAGGGGFSYLRRQASPWLSLDTYSESIGFEGTSVVEITFDASNVNAGTYTFSYDILSNDPANPVTTITFNLEVTGTPDLSIGEGSDFNFGDQFVGNTSSEGLLEIRNNGSATLNISDIQFDNAVFSATTTTAAVEPGEFATFELTFTPTEEQAYMATGTITSNEEGGTQTFAVDGTGIPVPDVSLDVTSIEAELLSGGLKEESFTITNNAVTSVSWEIIEITVPGVEAVLFEKADFADWTLEENQDRITDDVWLTRANNRGLFNIAVETEFSNDLRRLKAPSSKLGAIIIGPGRESGSPQGTLWGSSNTLETIYDEGYSSWSSVIGGNASNLEGTVKSMWIPEENRYFDIEFLSWTSGEGNEGIGGGGGVSYIRTESLGWINNFSSIGNTIEGEGNQTVTFDIDAEDIPAGDYAGTIVISDGLNTMDIDVTLTVLGFPEIAVEIESLDFDPVFVGDEATQTFEIANVGLADLEISEVSAGDNSRFSIVSAPSTIGINEVGIVEVKFAPTAPVDYESSIVISNNDATARTLSIDVTGTGKNPPRISLDKTSLEQTLFFGTSASQTFTISNTGDADLNWELGLSGGTVTFTKEDWADWTLPENQDRISENVWITRGDSRGIFNIALEEEYNNDEEDSPIGTLWARGATGEEEDFEIPCCFEERAVQVDLEGYGTWRNRVGGNPSSDQVYSMYIEETGAYYDVVFTSWTRGNDDGVPPGGGFSYERTAVFVDDFEAVSFSAVEGVIAPGQSQEVTVFFNPGGSFNGRFELPLQVESNDPSGSALIPLTLNVSGIIVENPIEDQLVNEGFGSANLDISSVFADAKGDPLTYTVESSDGTVASGTESGGTLTVTEAGTGTTTITITAEDGKGSSDSFDFDFRVNAVPTVAAAIADQSYNEGFGTQTVSLANVFADADAGDELTYSVSFSADGVVSGAEADGELTLTEQGVGTVNVTVTASDGSGGSVSDVFSVAVNEVLSAASLESVEFYPNPVADFLTIRNKDVSSIEIYHMDGKLVLSQEVSGKADLTTLDGGVYMVKLKDDSNAELYSGRLVKR